MWGSCSAPHGKGRAEHPMLVRSCRVPTEPALSWQGNQALPGCLHQDDPWGATSIPEQSQKGLHPQRCVHLQLLSQQALHAPHHHQEELPWMGNTPSGHSPELLQPFSRISCVGDLHLPKAGPRACLTSIRPHVPGPWGCGREVTSSEGWSQQL